MEYKVGLKVKTKQGYEGKIFRRFIREGKIYIQLQIKKFEYRVVLEDDIIEVIK